MRSHNTPWVYFRHYLTPSQRIMCRVGQNRIYAPYMPIYIWWFPCQNCFVYTPFRTICMCLRMSAQLSCVGLARTLYMHRTGPYIWWFPGQKYRICTVYIWFWPTLNMYHVDLGLAWTIDIWLTYNTFGKDFTKCLYTLYGVYVQFWLTLYI